LSFNYFIVFASTVESSKNDIGLCNTLSTALVVLWHHLITHC